MRDERTPKEVCGEATAPLYQERSFSLVYTQILVEYPLKLIRRAVPSGLLANLFFLLTLPPLCSPSALYEEPTVSSSPVKFTWKKLHLGKWLLIWSKSSLWRNRLASISWLLVVELPSEKSQFVAYLKYSFTTSNEKEMFLFMCFVWLSLLLFFFSRASPSLLLEGGGGGGDLHILKLY